MKIVDCQEFTDGQISRLDPHSYLLWFESDLTPHIEFTKPPPKDILRKARWGVGGGAVAVWNGAAREGLAGHDVDRRTAVGIDTGRRLLCLAVLGSQAACGQTGVLRGSWRPESTFFGIRAERLHLSP